MAISLNQTQLVQEFRKQMKEDLVAYHEAPQDVRQIFDETWVAFKEIAEFDDDNQADLAAFGALVQFAVLAENFEKDKLQEVLSLFSVSVLDKIKKGDRLD